MTIQVSSVADGVETQPTTKIDRAAYLARLLRDRPSLPPSSQWLTDLRQQGLALASEQTVPTARDEEWRFTDLSALVSVPFQPIAVAPTVVPSDIENLQLADTIRLVFVNGQYAAELSDVAGLPEGAIAASLSHLTPDQQTRLANYLGKQKGNEEIFTALNTASFTDGAVVWIPRNSVVQAPIHLLFLSSPNAQPSAVYPRCVVVAESGSQMTLVEEYVSVGSGAQFTNAVTEIWVEANAAVTHARIQRENNEAVHIGKTAISQGRDARYHGVAIGLGAQVSRHNLEVVQTGEQAHTTLHSLNVVADQQVADTHSAIAFTRPYGSSHQLHKAIVGDRAHAIFNGKIFVPKAAQLTDAGQLNRTLLLSPRAKVDTKPQLEIVADNVKCAHGATVSQLDAEEVFYLQSRGLDVASARQLLINAFAVEIIERIPVPQLVATLMQQVRQRVGH